MAAVRICFRMVVLPTDLISPPGSPEVGLHPARPFRLARRTEAWPVELLRRPGSVASREVGAGLEMFGGPVPRLVARQGIPPGDTVAHAFAATALSGGGGRCTDPGGWMGVGMEG